MTINDADTREAVGEGSLELELLAGDTAEARAHAREDTPAAAGTAATEAVTWRDTLAVRAAQWVAPKGSLLNSQPPTFAQQHERHQQCAAHFQSGIFRWPRLVWGYVHLLVVKPPLNLMEWITESPARTCVAVALCYVIHHFS